MTTVSNSSNFMVPDGNGEEIVFPGSYHHHMPTDKCIVITERDMDVFKSTVQKKLSGALVSAEKKWDDLNTNAAKDSFRHMNVLQLTSRTTRKPLQLIKTRDNQPSVDGNGTPGDPDCRWTCIEEPKGMIRLHNNDNYLGIKDGQTIVVHYPPSGLLDAMRKQVVQAASTVQEAVQEEAKRLQEEMVRKPSSERAKIWLENKWNETFQEEDVEYKSNAGTETLLRVKAIEDKYVCLVSEAEPGCYIGLHVSGELKAASTATTGKDGQWSIKIISSASPNALTPGTSNS